MSFEVHREPLYRRYYAPAASLSCCYAIVFGVALLVLPLIISYSTTTFWEEERIVYEQPTVQYRYQTFLELSGTKSSGDSAVPVNIFYSTTAAVNSLYSNTLRVPMLSSATLDDNKDGKLDRLEVNVQMPVNSDEKIHGFTALVYFNAQFTEKVRYLFDAVAYVHYSGGAMSAVVMDGDLRFRQTWPLQGTGGFKVPYSDQLIDVSSGSSASDVSISSIMRRSVARNFSMVFSPTYQQATSWGGNGVTMFNASITIRIPQQPVRYFAPPSVLLATAWVQYVAFFIVVAFAMFRVNSFVFRNQLLRTYPVADIVYEKMD